MGDPSRYRPVVSSQRDWRQTEAGGGGNGAQGKRVARRKFKPRCSAWCEGPTGSATRDREAGWREVLLGV
jgi:hypothetical protein